LETGRGADKAQRALNQSVYGVTNL